MRRRTHLSSSPVPSFSIGSTVHTYPVLPYKKIKDTILGTAYMLSVVFVGEKRARILNKTHRNKTYVPNILSFPLDHTHGEIYITPAIAKKEARERGMDERHYTGFLFIHGLLHLDGMSHGDTMERLEKKYCAQYHLV